MNVKTTGFIGKNLSTEELKTHVEQTLNTNVQVQKTTFPNYVLFSFPYKYKERHMNVHLAEIVLNTKGVQFSIEYSKEAVKLAEQLIEPFGGFIKKRDMAAEWKQLMPLRPQELPPPAEKQDKALFDLLEGYDLSLQGKTEAIRFIKENALFLKNLPIEGGFPQLPKKEEEQRKKDIG